MSALSEQVELADLRSVRISRRWDFWIGYYGRWDALVTMQEHGEHPYPTSQCTDSQLLAVMERVRAFTFVQKERVRDIEGVNYEITVPATIVTQQDYYRVRAFWRSRRTAVNLYLELWDLLYEEAAVTGDNPCQLEVVMNERPPIAALLADCDQGDELVRASGPAWNLPVA